MTGFARVRRSLPEGELILSVKSVNHRGLDMHFHLPEEFDPFENSIRAVINAYAQVRANLLKHAPGYLPAADPQKLVVEGQPTYGMAAVGKGKDTAGSQLILRALESSDPRPLWVTA